MSTPPKRLILSYNICFQAMCHENSGTAATLGGHCTWVPGRRDELTICARNIAKFIDGVPATIGMSNFDIVGLQEANNIDYLKLEAPKTLNVLGMIKSKSKATHGAHKMHMATFFNTNKYNLIESYCGQFNSYHTDRPFHILLLSDISSGELIIFINVHCPHGSDKNEKYGGYYRNFDTVNEDLSEGIKQMSQFDSSNNYKIIMTGDFNETGWNFGNRDLMPKKWRPLKSAGLTTDVGITNFVLSCSKDDGCWHKPNASRGGDYVFSSGIDATISVPQNYHYAKSGDCQDKSIMETIWQSDHLPVMAEVS